MDIRALALLLERVVSAAVSEALDQSASIIAPGRDGSQLGGACPDMVEGCSHDPGLSDGLVMVRGGWVRRGTWSPRFSVGNRAPRRIRSQATAQNHQGPQPPVRYCGPWHCCPECSPLDSSSSKQMIRVLRLSRPVVRGVNRRVSPESPRPAGFGESRGPWHYYRTSADPQRQYPRERF